MEKEEVEKKLLETYDLKFPLDEECQWRLVYALRRAYASQIVLHQELRQAREHNKTLDMMLQQWIIMNPSRNPDMPVLISKENTRNKIRMMDIVNQDGT